MSNPLLSFEHRIVRALAGTTQAEGWLVAVSGGVDSMVLAEVTRRWQKRFLNRLVLAHVHHGTGVPYRDEAQSLVRAFAREHRLPFVTNTPEADGPTDEAGLRALRLTHLGRWRRRYGLAAVALGHHADDLLETRLLRLLRGTGSRGLAAMHLQKRRVVRPLLGVTRAEIEAYARGRGLAWVEDPANAAVGSGSRAWLRHRWLPALDRRFSGARVALARSLEVLVEEMGPEMTIGSSAAACAGVRRAAYARLGAPARARVVSEYVTALGVRDFGRTHVLEISKRLDTARKEFTFRVHGVDFYVGADLWWASRVCD